MELPEKTVSTITCPSDLIPSVRNKLSNLQNVTHLDFERRHVKVRTEMKAILRT